MIDERTIAERAREYERAEPFATVEHDRLATLPDAFAAGSFDWKDAEWVVRWYCRRFLGEFPQPDREAIETRFRDNDFEAVERAIAAAVRSETTDERLNPLLSLAGVDVPVASAFLTYLDPDAYLTVDERTWGVLHEDGSLSAYPDPPSSTEYESYLAACRDVAGRVDLQSVYRALWRLSKAD